MSHRALIVDHYVLTTSRARGLGRRIMKDWFLLPSRQLFVAPLITALYGPEDIPHRQDFTFTPPTRTRATVSTQITSHPPCFLAPLRPNHRSDTPGGPVHNINTNLVAAQFPSPIKCDSCHRTLGIWKPCAMSRIITVTSVPSHILLPLFLFQRLLDIPPFSQDTINYRYPSPLTSFFLLILLLLFGTT